MVSWQCPSVRMTYAAEVARDDTRAWGTTIAMRCDGDGLEKAADEVRHVRWD